MLKANLNTYLIFKKSFNEIEKELKPLEKTISWNNRFIRQLKHFINKLLDIFNGFRSNQQRNLDEISKMANRLKQFTAIVISKYEKPDPFSIFHTKSNQIPNIKEWQQFLKNIKDICQLLKRKGKAHKIKENQLQSFEKQINEMVNECDKSLVYDKPRLLDQAELFELFGGQEAFENLPRLPENLPLFVVGISDRVNEEIKTFMGQYATVEVNSGTTTIMRGRTEGKDFFVVRAYNHVSEGIKNEQFPDFQTFVIEDLSEKKVLKTYGVEIIPTTKSNVHVSNQGPYVSEHGLKYLQQLIKNETCLSVYKGNRHQNYYLDPIKSNVVAI